MYVILQLHVYVYLNVLLARMSTVWGILNGSEVIHYMLVAKRTVCCFRATREEHMLSLHSAKLAYGMMLLSEFPMST